MEEALIVVPSRPFVLWLTGLSGAGKTTLGKAMCNALTQTVNCLFIDGDELRQGLSSDLGFSKEHRYENVRRAAEVAKIGLGSGLCPVVALISPHAEARLNARRIVQPTTFVEVYLSTSVEVTETRDVRGLYKEARAQHIERFTGVSDVYEAPINPDVCIDTGVTGLYESVCQIKAYLRAQRLASGGF